MTLRASYVSYTIAMAHQKYCIPCVGRRPPVTKSLKAFDVQQLKSFENILRTFLPEEFSTQATLPITLSGLGVHQCEDKYKTTYVGLVFCPLKILFQKSALKTKINS